MRRFDRFGPILALASALAAQGYVSPAHFTAVEGDTNNVYPFGDRTPFRFLQVHDDVPAMLISGFAFRYDINTTGYAHSITLDAWVSTAATTSQTTSATFDSNHGADKIQVAFNRTYNVPGGDPRNLPRQFVIDYPFDVPFLFLAGGPSLCWEVHVTASTFTTANVLYDAVGPPPILGSASNPSLASASVGTGCLATGRTLVMSAWPVASPMNWGAGTGTLAIDGDNLPGSGVVFFSQGLGRTQFNGIPLPALIPTSTGAPSGNCTLYLEPAVNTLAVVAPNGTASLNQSFPVNPGFHGLLLYTQIIGLDLAANPFGIVTSTLAMHQVVAPYTLPPQVSRVYLRGSLGATGTVSTGGLLVTKFY